MVPLLSSILRHFRWLRDVRRDVDKTIVKPKVHSFAPVGSKSPAGRSARTRDGVLKNLAYIRQELVRWDRSLAIVHDLATPFTESIDGMVDMWRLVQKVLTDANANQINAILVNVLDSLADFACAVVRNLAVWKEVSAVLLLAFARACEAFEPFCAEPKDAHMVRAMNAVQKMQLRNLLSTKYGSNIPWTEAEMDKYIYKVERGTPLREQRGAREMRAIKPRQNFSCVAIDDMDCFTRGTTQGMT